MIFTKSFEPPQVGWRSVAGQVIVLIDDQRPSYGAEARERDQIGSVPLSDCHCY